MGHKIQNLEGNGTGHGLLPGMRDTEEAQEGQRGNLRVSLSWDHLTEHLHCTNRDTEAQSVPGIFKVTQKYVKGQA